MGQLHNLTGSQVGAYFGHAVAVCDVNGDGLDDVVIGAPLHTDFSLSGGRYETGRVYVVYQNREVRYCYNMYYIAGFLDPDPDPDWIRIPFRSVDLDPYLECESETLLYTVYYM
jgi:hypothetical protein